MKIIMQPFGTIETQKVGDKYIAFKFNEKKDELEITSHYAYCDLILNYFWKQIFNGRTLEETNCAGIISAHGDKCRQYQRKFESNDIDFCHGTLMYLLSYTEVFDDENRYNIPDWIIRKYPIYKSMIENAENEFKKEIKRG